MPRKKSAPKPTAPTPSPMPHKSADLGSHGGKVALDLAMTYLAEGFTVTAAAKGVGVHRDTVRAWRDSPAGQKKLDEIRKQRADQFADAADQARRILREAAPKAATRLVARLGSKVPFEAVTAADQLLARVGLPRTTKVETSPEEEYDLSKLSDAQRAALDELLTLARRDG